MSSRYIAKLDSAFILIKSMYISLLLSLEWDFVKDPRPSHL